MTRAIFRRAVGVLLGVLAVAAVAVLAPSPLPDSRVENTISIRRPPEDVFRYVTTPGNWPRWHPSSIAVRGAVDHPLALGETVTEDFVVAGRRGTVRWTVVAREEPAHWTIEGRNEGSRGGGRVSYRLTPQDGGTQFHRELVYRMPNLLGAVADRLGVHDRVAAESSVAVENLKAILERNPGR